MPELNAWPATTRRRRRARSRVEASTHGSVPLWVSSANREDVPHACCGMSSTVQIGEWPFFLKVTTSRSRCRADQRTRFASDSKSWVTWHVLEDERDYARFAMAWSRV